MDKLTVAGHSFGGITALQLAVNKKVKAAVCLDPWYLPVHQKITDPISDKETYRLS